MEPAEEIEIQNAAEALRALYGPRAFFIAARNAAAMEQRGEAARFRRWAAIVRALAPDPPAKSS